MLNQSSKKKFWVLIHRQALLRHCWAPPRQWPLTRGRWALLLDHWAHSNKWVHEVVESSDTFLASSTTIFFLVYDILGRWDFWFVNHRIEMKFWQKVLHTWIVTLIGGVCDLRYIVWKVSLLCLSYFFLGFSFMESISYLWFWFDLGIKEGIWLFIWLTDSLMNTHVYNNAWNYDDNGFVNGYEHYVWKYVMIIIDYEHDIT